MDFVKRTIIDHETVITKELLDSFQDGIIEGIRKAEAALAIQPAVYNASIKDEFPSVGSPTVIYKAEKERLLYQWNSEELKYEPLCHAGSSGNIEDGTVVNGGGAAGVGGLSEDGEQTVIINGGDASGVDD